jgi:hypothetical protein
LTTIRECDHEIGSDIVVANESESDADRVLHRDLVTPDHRSVNC